jgi:hypothetical protein
MAVAVALTHHGRGLHQKLGLVVAVVAVGRGEKWQKNSKNHIKSSEKSSKSMKNHQKIMKNHPFYTIFYIKICHFPMKKVSKSVKNHQKSHPRPGIGHIIEHFGPIKAKSLRNRQKTLGAEGALGVNVQGLGLLVKKCIFY